MLSLGAEQILKSNFTLHSLDLGKNAISSKIGTTLQYFVSNSMKLQSLNLEHNNLQLRGIEFLTSVESIDVGIDEQSLSETAERFR